METKWQAKWNYYGWKEYLDVIPDRPSMQGDWNSTLLTKINQMRVKQNLGLIEDTFYLIITKNQFFL